MMEEKFIIGDFVFEPDNTTSATNFDYSGALSITIAARTVSVQEAVAAELLDDYEPTGEISIAITTFGVYQPDAPTGTFHYAEDKQEGSYHSLYKKGFNYSLKFYGEVILGEGWVTLQGQLKPSWADSPQFPVTIHQKIETAGLDWSNYCFTSLEETLEAPVENVRKLTLTNPKFDKLPNDFYRLKALQRVEITARYPERKLPLERLDDKLLQMKELEYLVVADTQLCRIPEYMNQLVHLKHCSFAKGDLSRVPAHLMDMPNLEYLNLNDNQLSSIAVFDMPNLKYLHLANNQLQTLPENLLALPKIEKINVSKNPFSFLPAAFSNFKGLDMDMESKQRLLDNTYKNADGEATVAWDDKVFYAEHDEALIQPVDDIISEEGLTEHRDALRALVKKAIGLTLAGEDDYSQTGNHRFGGMPDLPAGVDYPQYYDDYDKKHYHYEFIAQVNCEQLAPLQDYLPKTGTLFFFFETIHHLGPANRRNPCQVIYVADNATLQSGKRFSFNEEDFYELPDGQYPPNRATANVKNAAPAFYPWHVNRYLFRGVSKSLLNEEDLLDNELSEQFEEPVKHLDESSHQVNAYGFTQHESPELQAALAQKGNPEDWTILLTVTSRGGFEWGDAGDLFFVIHKSDLARKDFRQVFVTLESS